MPDDAKSIGQRAAKAVEDAFDEELKARFHTMLTNIAGAQENAVGGAAGMMKKGLLQMKEAREVALKVMAEVFGA